MVKGWNGHGLDQDGGGQGDGDGADRVDDFADIGGRRLGLGSFGAQGFGGLGHADTRAPDRLSRQRCRVRTVANRVRTKKNAGAVGPGVLSVRLYQPRFWIGT